MKKKLKIVLVNLFTLGRHLTIGFPLGLEALAGDLRKRYKEKLDVEIIDMQQGLSEGKTVDLIKDRAPDILGLSVKTGDRHILESILNKIYSCKFPKGLIPKFIILGGFRPRVFPDEFVNKYRSVIVCQSEGEPTMRGMVEFLWGEKSSLEEVPNLVFSKNGQIIKSPIQGLDFRSYNLPSMDTLQYIIERNGMVYWEASRGCSWNICSFCNRRFSKGIKPRYVPDDIFLDGFEQLYRAGVKYVYFADDDFLMGDVDRVVSVANEIIKREINIKFWIQTRVRNIYNDQETRELKERRFEALRRLKDAGLRRIFLGLESGSPSQLKRYTKGIDLLSMERAIEIIRKVGIQLEVGCIPIDPLVTLNELKDTVDFVKRNNIEESIVKILNILCVQKGIPAFGAIKREGLILGEKDIDTLLYPYHMKNREVQGLVDIIREWQNETLNFVYALRRIVDASDEGILEEKYLNIFRKIDFTLLKELVLFCSADTIIARDIYEIQESFAKLGVKEEDTAELIALLKDIKNTIYNKEDKDSCIRLFVDLLRHVRNSLIEEFMALIENGHIEDKMGFLRKSIFKSGLIG